MTTSKTWRDAWVENDRVLVRLEGGRVLEVGLIHNLLMMALSEEAILKEKEMEKYGVELDNEDPKIKKAADKSVCPECGEKLESHANVPKCPVHGVRPFEKDIDLEDTIPED